MENFNFINFKAIFLENYNEHFVNHVCIKFIYNNIYFYMEDNDQKKLM